MKYLVPAIRFNIFMTVLLGLAYPFAMTGITQILFPSQASGNFLSRGGQIIGARLISQNFERPEYFWSRPSAIGYNPMPSGGSNLGQANSDLKKSVDDRRAKLKAANPEMGEPPQDLLFASASGLDPEISPEAALYQISRVAKARAMDMNQVKQLVIKYTEGPQWRMFGESRVNVLELNLALDESQGIRTAPVYIAPPAAPATPAPETTPQGQETK